MAASLGLILDKSDLKITEIPSQPWFYYGLILGALFIIMFFIIGTSAQKAGITITTVSSKMSVVIPILFSITYYHVSINSIKIKKIVTAVIAVVLTVYRKRDRNFNASYIYLPVLLFVGLGLIDIFVKFNQQEFVGDGEASFFTATLFAFAGIIGFIIAGIKKLEMKGFFQIKTIMGGIILGTANFGSIYFLILTLNQNFWDSSIVFGVNNVGIVVFSILIAIFFFKEKPKPINIIGIILAILSIITLSFHDKIAL